MTLVEAYRHITRDFSLVGDPYYPEEEYELEGFIQHIPFPIQEYTLWFQSMLYRVDTFLCSAKDIDLVESNKLVYQS